MHNKQVEHDHVSSQKGLNEALLIFTMQVLRVFIY